MGVALLYAYRAQSPSAQVVTYDRAVAEIQSGQVAKVTISGDTSTIEKTDKSIETVNIGANDNGAFQKIVTDYNAPLPPSQRVQLSFQKDSATFGIIGSVLLSLLPVLLIGGFFVYMMRQAQGTNNQALSFGKSRARMFIGNKPTVTFDDVAGVDEAKQELTEVVEFLKYPEKFSTLGARIPRGVLLVGPPGTGKTMLARAVAGEAGVPFFSISGSQFPAMLAGVGGAHGARGRPLTQTLAARDGFATGTNVVVPAAPSGPGVLAPALLRRCRGDRQVVLDRPDTMGRRGAADVHVRGKPLDKSVD